MAVVKQEDTNQKKDNVESFVNTFTTRNKMMRRRRSLFYLMNIIILLCISGIIFSLFFLLSVDIFYTWFISLTLAVFVLLLI